MTLIASYTRVRGTAAISLICFAVPSCSCVIATEELASFSFKPSSRSSSTASSWFERSAVCPNPIDRFPGLDPKIDSRYG